MRDFIQSQRRNAIVSDERFTVRESRRVDPLRRIAAQDLVETLVRKVRFSVSPSLIPTTLPVMLAAWASENERKRSARAFALLVTTFHSKSRIGASQESAASARALRHGTP